MLPPEDQQFSKIVTDIDTLIRQQEWFDMHVYSYQHNKLVIAGGVDLTYYHSLEIIFEEVNFFSGYMSGWHADTSKPVFELPAESTILNLKFENIQGYTLFRFNSEDTPDIYIAAAAVSYNTDTVYYYNRPDLKENERLADFVKPGNSAE
jgi:hypothetical protein